MSIGYFVTGTDTEIGKTLVSTALLHALAQCGLRTAAMKPVAAGAEWRDEDGGHIGGRNGAWHNDDVDRLCAAATVTLPMEWMTPYLLRDAVAPHIAAAHADIVIDTDHICACYKQAAAMADAIVVEGVGGFRVPLSEHSDSAALAQQLNLPVVMVVGLRLGCLNHALLTADAIAACGLKLAGWVANMVDINMNYVVDNVGALVQRLDTPLLGYLPRLDVPSPGLAAAHLDFSCLPDWPGRRADSL